MITSVSHKLVAFIIALFALLSAGCATQGAPKADPFEGMNRATYKFNDTVDRAVLKPVAKGYQAVTPQFVRSGISNAFINLGDVGTALNNLLQGKPGNAVSDTGRFLINSTLGVLGLFDVATPMGLEKHSEDFGQTLGKWGVNSGPYIVIPFMGPSTLRDLVAKPVDSYTGYSHYVGHIPTRNTASAVELIDFRANLLGASDTLEGASLDSYQFLRDAFLQRRQNQVYDGKVPQEKRDKLEDDLDSSGPAANVVPSVAPSVTPNVVPSKVEPPANAEKPAAAATEATPKK